MYYVYLIKSQRYNEIYTGSTNDLRRRLFEHNKGIEISTKRYKPWRLVYYEAYQSERDAREREMRLKHHGNAIKELKKRIRCSLTDMLGLPSTILHNKNGAGFTLIELMVSLAIISMLIAASFAANYRTSLSRGRDARREADVRRIQQAFEQYYGANQKYDTCSTMRNAGYLPGNAFPTDPRGGNYEMTCSSSTYCVCADLEQDDVGNASDLSCTWAASGDYFCVGSLQ